MALSESALSELLVALTDRDRGVDLVRELAEWLAQQLIEVQATQAIGAGRYERSDERVTERNGHRPRTLTTKAGDLELAIPKLRKGSFFPSILEPRRRIDQALYAVVTVRATLVTHRREMGVQAELAEHGVHRGDRTEPGGTISSQIIHAEPGPSRMRLQGGDDPIQLTARAELGHLTQPQQRPVRHPPLHPNRFHQRQIRVFLVATTPNRCLHVHASDYTPHRPTSHARVAPTPSQRKPTLRQETPGHSPTHPQHQASTAEVRTDNDDALPGWAWALGSITLAAIIVTRASVLPAFSSGPRYWR